MYRRTMAALRCLVWFMTRSLALAIAADVASPALFGIGATDSDERHVATMSVCNWFLNWSSG
jgi:hypothetical protein